MADRNLVVSLLITAKDRASGVLGGVKSGLLGVAAVATSIIGGFTGLAASVLGANKEFQSLKASLETVTGSTKAADEAFSQIEAFAKNTPFQLNEAVGAFIKLKALGLDPSMEALESYGNTASAMGINLDQFIEAVADASVGEFERLKEFGIKASSEGENVAFTFQGITTTVGKNAGEIEGYLRGLGQVQFAGAMEKQMQTLGGQLSNLSDAFSKVARDIGNAGANEAMSRVFAEMIRLVETGSKVIVENSALIGKGFKFTVDLLMFFGNGIRGTFNILSLGVTTVTKGVVDSLGILSTALERVTFGSVSEKWRKNSEDFAAISAKLGQQIDTDVKDLSESLKGYLNAFDDNPIEAKVEIKSDTKKDMTTVSQAVKKEAEAISTDPASAVKIKVGTDKESLQSTINDVRELSAAEEFRLKGLRESQKIFEDQARLNLQNPYLQGQGTAEAEAEAMLQKARAIAEQIAAMNQPVQLAAPEAINTQTAAIDALQSKLQTLKEPVNLVINDNVEEVSARVEGLQQRINNLNTSIATAENQVNQSADLAEQINREALARGRR